MVSVYDCLQRINAALQLLGQLDNSGAPPASEEAIKTLKIVTITQKDVGELRGILSCLIFFCREL